MLLVSTEAVKGVGSLVDLGLKTSASGTLSLEGTALDDALAADPEGINALLDRLGSTLDENLERFEGTDGLVQARINGFEARLDALDDRERLDRRMVSVQARYERNSALDTLIAGMNQTVAISACSWALTTRQDSSRPRQGKTLRKMVQAGFALKGTTAFKT